MNHTYALDQINEMLQYVHAVVRAWEGPDYTLTTYNTNAAYAVAEYILERGFMESDNYTEQVYMLYDFYRHLPNKA